MSNGRISMVGRDVTAAASLRQEVLARKKGEGRMGGFAVTQTTHELEKGFKLFVKLKGGRNVSRAMDHDLLPELSRLGLSRESLNEAVNDLVDYCVAVEDKEGKLPQRLSGASIEIDDLIRLCYGNSFERFDNYFRLKSAQRLLMKMNVAVHYDGVPLKAVHGDRVELMDLIARSGYDMQEVEGAIEFLKSGEITLPAPEGVVELSDLMQALAELMGG